MLNETPQSERIKISDSSDSSEKGKKGSTSKNLEKLDILINDIKNKNENEVKNEKGNNDKKPIKKELNETPPALSEKQKIKQDNIDIPISRPEEEKKNTNRGSYKKIN